MFTCKYHSCNSTESMLLQGLPRWLSGKRIHLPMQEMQVQFLGQEDPLEEEMAIHSSISYLENPMDRGAWRTTGHGVTKSQKRLNTRNWLKSAKPLG